MTIVWFKAAYESCILSHLCDLTVLLNFLCVLYRSLATSDIFVIVPQTMLKSFESCFVRSIILRKAGLLFV